MSLLVNVFVRRADGELELLEPADHSEELAGFESFRTTIYGSRTARDLGLRLFPKLADGDLWVEGDDVERLLCEAETALAHVSRFADGSGVREEVLQVRLANVILAARQALAVGGGVVVW